MTLFDPGRQKDMASRRVLDNASRQRRLRKAIEALEQDNYQADPHADLKMSKKAPKFDESMEMPAGKHLIAIVVTYMPITVFSI